MPQLDFLELASDETEAAKAERFRYVCGVRFPNGPFHVSDITTEMPPESFVGEWHSFLKKFQGGIGQHLPTQQQSRLRKINYLKTRLQAGRRGYGQLGQMYKTPELLQNLEIQMAVTKKRPFVPVRIVSFSEQKAYCKARLEGFWIGIELERSDLEKLDLLEGDSFEWIPRDDGKVFNDDIRSHPRKPNPGEYARAERAFSDLAKLQQELKR